MSSHLFGATDRRRVKKLDLKFTETISQCMQVPSRLQIVEQSTAAGDGEARDDHPASLRMHIPDRISLADIEMMEVGLRPLQLEQRRWKPPVFTSISSGHSSHAPRSSELPLIKTAAKSRSSNPKGMNRSQKVQTTEASPDTRGALNQHTGTLDLVPNTSDKPVEDLGLMEVVAMRKLLIKISGRLQSLEEEKEGCYQKELLIYSALLTACLINTLLCLRR